MLRVTGGMRSQPLLVGLLLILMSIPLASAKLNHPLMPGLNVEPALCRPKDEVFKATRKRREPFTRDIRLLIVFKEKHNLTHPAGEADPVYARMTEAHIEGMNRPRPFAIIPRIPTIQLLDCTTLTDEDVCKSLMCTWEAARCHETTATTGATAVAKPLSHAEEQALKRGDSFRECDNCPEMVVIPAGSFMMGSPANERDRLSSETQVPVSIAAPFAVDKYAVTFDEWDTCVADGGCNGYTPADQGWGRGRRPVINVNWHDAKAYAAWVSRKTGKTYRLLSEAEREYVTRASTTTAYYWGSSIRTTQANYNGKVQADEAGSRGGNRLQTMVVDSFEPNAWGLYQVHGNVWEWTEDCWHDSNDGNPADGSARTAGECGLRVVRGGSWDSHPQSLRSASRRGITAVVQSFDVGFRLARALRQ
jgi:formylglycine-generating enzyme required for sulfatase activity